MIEPSNHAHPCFLVEVQLSNISFSLDEMCHNHRLITRDKQRDFEKVGYQTLDNLLVPLVSLTERQTITSRLGVRRGNRNRFWNAIFCAYKNE